MKPVFSNKILIVIPFWKGDKAQSMAMARYLADIEPVHSQQADVLFVARKDCSHDEPTVRYVARKFNTFKHTSARAETGWPQGCNGLFFGAMEFVYHKAAAGQIPNYKAAFIAEGDGVPLRRDWLTYLQLEWSRVKAKVAGALIPHPNHYHINGGCCMISGDLKFLHWLVKNVGGVNVAAGWDWILAGDFARWGWADIPGIKSRWNTPSMSREQVENEMNSGTVWLHGCKDFSALSHSRAILKV